MPRTAVSCGDHLLVGKSIEMVQVQRAVEHLLGERAQVRNLRVREADRLTQLIGIVLEDLHGRGRATPETIGQPPVYGLRGPRRELLADD